MRTILFSFPVHPIRSRPEGHSQPPRTLPKKRAVWRCHMLRGPLLSCLLVAGQPMLVSQRLGFLPLAHLAQLGDQAPGRTTRLLMIHAVDQHAPL
eukprot:scaffold60622_cov42-Phaeocystis_antarctica.AAC.1